MAEPTLSLTFQDLILRVAEFLGLADYAGGPAAIPSNAHDLDLCKRLVNDGYRRFINANPTWNFLTPLVSITFAPAYTGTATAAAATTLTDSGRTEAAGFFDNTWSIWITAGTGAGQTNTISAWNSGAKQFTVGTPWTITPDTTSSYSLAPAQCVLGDNRRYYMPDGFYGSVLMPWTYPSTGPRKRIVESQEGILRELYAGGNVAGDPIYVAFRPEAATPSTSGKRWEAFFWPAPQTAYTVTTRARLYPDKLVNNSDRHVCGFQHDEAVLAAAMAEAERQRDDSMDYQAKNYEAALARSIGLDRASNARRLGDYGDHSESRYIGRRPLSYYSVDTYNGIGV